jgi:hypothetical protein
MGHPPYDSIDDQRVNNMPIFEKLSVEAVLRLPPMLFGVIRWRKSIGSPSGDPCSGFRIRVEERTPSEFRAGPGGVIEKIPGIGIRLTRVGRNHGWVPPNGKRATTRFH